MEQTIECFVDIYNHTVSNTMNDNNIQTLCLLNRERRKPLAEKVTCPAEQAETVFLGSSRHSLLLSSHRT